MSDPSPYFDMPEWDMSESKQPPLFRGGGVEEVPLVSFPFPLPNPSVASG